MPNVRLSMRKIKEVLRLKYENGLSNRNTARSLSISRSTVAEYINRARSVGITWPIPEGMDEAALERLLFPQPEHGVAKVGPDWSQIYQEYKRPHVTLALLWVEYKEKNPQGYQYTRFCQLYNEWAGTLDVVMRQDHKVGEKVFVDYCGATIPVTDSSTGEMKQAQVFVAVLGASNYTYAEATWSQGLSDWIGSHVRAFEDFGGVPQIIVPDNLRSGVSEANLYEPDINPTYQEMATYYNTAVIPARVRKPRDKAKVETGVLLVQRWIVARLRHETFFSLTGLNARIKELLVWINNRRFKELEGSRQSLFISLDKPALGPLPKKPYEYAEWKIVRVHPDYHVEVDRHYYSVPYQLYKKQLDVRITAATIECFYRGKRVASHVRSYEKGRHTTITEHMPKPHQAMAAWTPQRLVNWAGTCGDSVAILVEKLLDKYIHPQQGFRPALGVIRLGKGYGNDRLDAACKRALQIGGITYKSVESILRNGYDQIEFAPKDSTKPIQHTNIRGSHYYQ